MNIILIKNTSNSPEALRNKIIIKGKKLKSGNEDGEVSDEDEAAEIQGIEHAEHENNHDAKKKKKKHVRIA